MSESVGAPHGAEAAPQAGDVSGAVVPESDGVGATGAVADIADSELVRRVVMNLRSPRHRRKVWLWTLVSEAFALGSTYSRQLCRRFGIDPDKLV